VSRLTSVTMSEVKSRYTAFARLAHFATETELAQLR
jgi:hypothetical protein